MTHPFDILAAGVGDWIEIIVILALVAISLLARLAKKVGEDKQARQQKERWQQVQGEGEAARSAQPQAGRARPQAQAPRPAPSSRPAPTPADQVAQALKRAMGLFEQPPAPRPPAILKPATPKPPQTLTPMQARPTLASVASVESAAARTQVPLPNISQVGNETDAYAITQERATIDVRLLDPEQARRAIILHEILSPPKALRQGGEMWDT